jgi:tetratricopeptide (TPR) repeat protein
VLGDNGAAIASAQRAVREDTTNAELHMQLAEYYLVGHNWKEAVHQLQELLKQRPDPTLELRALLELSTTLADRMGKPQLAESHANAALAIDPDNRVALGLLLRVQLDQPGDAAAATAARLVRVCKDPVERAEALTHLGRVSAKHGHDKKAAEAFVDAVAILGPGSAAAAQFQDWLKAQGKKANWQLYADALSRFLSSAALDDARQKTARAELGRTLEDRLGRADLGLEELTRALGLDPADVELRVDLARRLFRAGQLEAAAKHYHDLVRSQPSEAAHYRALSSCYERSMRVEEARWVLGALVWTGNATPEEARRYRETPPRPGAVAARALDAQGLSVIERDAPVAGPALELLSAMAPALPKLYPPPFESYGVNKSDRIGTRTNNSLRHIADRVAQIFGVEEFELYVHQSKAPLVTVELSDAPALFVNANVSALNEAEQVFVFARAFANIARGLHFVDRLGPAELRALFVAAARTQVPRFGEGKGDTKTLDAIGRRITKAMPWFTGGRLETAARTYASARLSFSGWVDNVTVSSAAAALLASDDLASALRLLRQIGTQGQTLERIQSFAVSEAALELRRRLFGS